MIDRRSASPRSRAPFYAALSAVLALSFVLAGCGAKDEPAASEAETPSAQDTEGGTKIAAVWPLTGLKAPATVASSPVVAVKIDNTSSSRPQVGLGSADMVVEELVEGGITRLAALFQSTIPGTVGPVRSMRASDMGVVKPAQATLVASGGARVTLIRVRQGGVPYYTEGGPGYFRERSRRAPYNLMVRLPDLVAKLKAPTKTLPSYLPWGQASDFVGSSAAKNISVKFSSATTTKFLYSKNANKYVNTNTHASSADQFKADSVLVLRVKEVDAGYRDPAGNPVPETLFFGQGSMLLFHQGQVLRGTWVKPKRESPVTLKTAAGEIKMPAGKVWIELLPTTGNTAVTFN